MGGEQTTLRIEGIVLVTGIHSNNHRCEYKIEQPVFLHKLILRAEFSKKTQEKTG